MLVPCQLLRPGPSRFRLLTGHWSSHCWLASVNIHPALKLCGFRSGSEKKYELPPTLPWGCPSARWDRGRVRRRRSSRCPRPGRTWRSVWASAWDGIRWWQSVGRRCRPAESYCCCDRPWNRPRFPNSRHRRSPPRYCRFSPAKWFNEDTLRVGGSEIEKTYFSRIWKTGDGVLRTLTGWFSDASSRPRFGRVVYPDVDKDHYTWRYVKRPQRTVQHIAQFLAQLKTT